MMLILVGFRFGGLLLGIDLKLDQLLKYQLYTTAAYFRKHSKVQQIKNITLVRSRFGSA